jgi:hypothetical protein
MKGEFLGYHSEWNLGSPGGWDYQRITQEIGKAVWKRIHPFLGIEAELDFNYPLLHPVNRFVEMLLNACFRKEGRNTGLIVVMAEEETLEDVIENSNLVSQLNMIKGIKSVLLAPQYLEIKNGKVSYHGDPVGLIFMDFNTNILLDLHRKNNLEPVLQAVREGRVINPRGTEPVNSKGVFEVLTDPGKRKLFNSETVRRTPWTRQFYNRKTTGPDDKEITDLVEWTRKNWNDLVLKPERGYSGKGVKVGGKDANIDNIIETALKSGDYIVQQKIPLGLWGEMIPELDLAEGSITLRQFQTDFRCLFGKEILMGFLGRFGGVPTNVGSGGGVQPLAVVTESTDIRILTDRINDTIINLGLEKVVEISEYQDKLALENRFTYLLGPIKIALRPRLIKVSQMKALEKYCHGIWNDCLILEKMWKSGELGIRMEIDHEELEIIKSQPWNGSPAILATDGLFSFGAHIL